MSDKLQFVAKLRQAKACRTSNCITTAPPQANSLRYKKPTSRTFTRAWFERPLFLHTFNVDFTNRHKLLTRPKEIAGGKFIGRRIAILFTNHFGVVDSHQLAARFSV